ncbi:signal peptidase I [Flavobacterium sp. F372]|uniref:Signal peptidase I n=1 Tax=Flavobacterium bernardetii TaxID=2813823 RepID=A0ABR7J271_9FLAO|nr:signal peptidase I [Flavobacterium bernardetii]MBC5836037.1 signal peptidase I [Flavobacterium bernardetii]NHF71223.1 signal peptidase I [Flavobacterium bernardetii]
MDISTWIITLLVISTLHGICSWKLYVKAGRKAWEAFVPVYNGIVLMQIINRPKWWMFLVFLPVINLLILPVIWIETLRTFGKKTTADMWLGVVTLGLYIGYVNYTQDVSYEAKRETKPATKALDTLGSLTFALIVATFVHTYFIQPFVIPSSSLEKSLLIGDFLFVSKFHYGARTPMTPIAAPMVHDSIPVIKKLSYLSKPQLPYFRFPALEKIKNNDIVVFNWPRDTLSNMYIRATERIDKPRDKKTNYVKRCVGIPGDSLQIKDGIVFVNGKELILPERAKPQYSYEVTYDANTPIDFEGILKELNSTDGAGFKNDARDTLYIRALTFEGAEKLKTVSGIKTVNRVIEKGPKDGVFPDFEDGNPSVTNDWNGDNFGPIYIPEAGKTVTLNKETLPLYKIIITEYEGNTLEVKGNEIKINGKIANSYTFKQDYFWMMGDNRHCSLDARYFGYTPADHIVGKPIFIWMSLDWNAKGLFNKFRTERFFTTVSGEGQPESYFKYFLILLAGYFAWDWYRGKKKKKEADLL